MTWYLRRVGGGGVVIFDREVCDRGMDLTKISTISRGLIEDTLKGGLKYLLG